MKLAIIGSRTFNDYGKLSNIIQEHFFGNLSPINKIISGGAYGADILGENFARDFNIKKEVYKPDWDKFGKSAGFIRNQEIVDACDMVLAFWDGKSKGTQDTINKAKKAKKPTFVVYF